LLQGRDFGGIAFPNAVIALSGADGLWRWYRRRRKPQPKERCFLIPPKPDCRRPQIFSDLKFTKTLRYG
jgi:hypothetical protein